MPGQSAIKKGDRCRIENQILSAKGKDFSCTKAGKKLVWKKLPKTKVSDRIALPLPVPLNSPGSSASTVRYGSLEEERVHKSIMASLIPGEKGNPLRYHFSPSAVPQFKEFLIKDLERSMAYWSNNYSTSEPFNVFYGTEKDLDWIIEAWKPYGYDTGFANDLRGRIAREGNTLNAGAVPSQGGLSHLSILRHSTLPINSGDYTFIIHESIHIVQQSLTKSRTYAMPCWLREGSANLFANYMAIDFHKSNYSDLKRQDLNSFTRGSSGVNIRNFTAEEWFQHVKGLEGNFSGTCDYLYRFAYGTGLLLSEIFVSDFGFEAMMDLWRSFQKEAKFEILFKEVTGREVDTWYRENAIPYVMREYSRIGR
jgi:hypothetical protein